VDFIIFCIIFSTGFSLLYASVFCAVFMGLDLIAFVSGAMAYIFSCLGWHFCWQPLRQLFFRPESASNASIFVWFIVNTCGRCFFFVAAIVLELVVCFIFTPPSFVFCHFFAVGGMRWVACQSKSIKMFAFSRSLAFTHVVVAGSSNCGKWILGCFP